MMTKCKECSNVVSSKAEKCPHCGFKPRRTHPVTKALAYFMAGTAALVFVVAAFSPPPTAEQQAARAETSMREEAARVGVLTLKASLRDPESLSIDSVHVSAAGVACIEYRARNGFGGMNRGSALIGGGLLSTKDSAPEFARDWNAACAMVRDFTSYARIYE